MSEMTLMVRREELSCAAVALNSCSLYLRPPAKKHMPEDADEDEREKVAELSVSVAA